MRRSLPVLAILLMLGGAMRAAIPTTLNYQGRLRDKATGDPVADSTGNSVIFQICSASDGSGVLWTENWNGPNYVSTTAGLFNVVLGSLNPINLLFDQQYWLQIQWKKGGSYETMTPLQPLTTAPYAFRAAYADSAAVSAPLALSLSSNSSAPLSAFNPSQGPAFVASAPSFGPAIIASGAYYAISATAFGNAGITNVGISTTATETGAFGQSTGLYASAENPSSPFTSRGIKGVADRANGIGIEADSANGIALAVNSASGKGIIAQASTLGISVTASGAAAQAVYARGNSTAPVAEFINDGAGAPLKINGMKFPSTDGGVAGNVLKTDGLGNLSFTAPVGVSVPLSLTFNAAASAPLSVSNASGSALLASGNVGVMANGSSFGVSAVASAAGGVGVYGFNGSSAGIGLYGVNTATSGGANGVRGESSSSQGSGVYGQNAAAGNVGYGVFGVNNSSSGYAVYGVNSSPGGPAIAVYGATGSVAGYGVYGENSTAGNTGAGIFGRNFSGQGYGVFGSNVDSSGAAAGVYGQSLSSPSGIAVVAEGKAFGLSATAKGAAGQAVYGRANSTAPTGEFINDGSGMAVHGSSNNFTGVLGDSVSFAGVEGHGVNADGVFGHTDGFAYGVKGQGTPGNNTAGVYGFMGADMGIPNVDVGVLGADGQANGRGVFGRATSSAGTSIGVVAMGGAFGLSSTATNAAGEAVYGRANSTAPTAEFINDGLGTPLKINAMKFPANDGGSAGNVLKTDGAGNLSFGPPSGVSVPLNLTNASTASTLYAVNTNSSTAAYAIYARQTNFLANNAAIVAEGATYGISATASSGTGILGQGAQAGVSGTSVAGGFGIYGVKVGGGGGSGVKGEVDNVNIFSSAVLGVVGGAAAFSCAGCPVAGVGIMGLNDQGNGWGGYFRGGATGRGVVAEGGNFGLSATASAAAGQAIYARASSSASAASVTNDGSGPAILGTLSNANTFQGAVVGTVNGANPAYGVFGTDNTGNGGSAGVNGSSANGMGVHGTATTGTGVYGISTSGIGTYGISTSGTGVNANSNSGRAVLANTSSGTLPAIEADQFSNGPGVSASSLSSTGISASSTYFAAVSAQGVSAVVASGSLMGLSATASAAAGQAVYGRGSSTAPIAEFINDSASGVALKVNGMKYPASDGTNGQMLATSATGQLYWANGGNGTVTQVYAGTGLLGGGASYAPLSVNAGTGANQIVQLDASSRLPGVDGSQLINLAPPSAPLTMALSSGVNSPLGAFNNGAGPALTATSAAGVAISAKGSTIGLSATASGGTGPAVYARNAAAAADAITGINDSVNGIGIHAIANNAGTGKGMIAEGGLVGISATASGGGGQAIYGRASSTAPVAEFVNDSLFGVALKVNGMKYPATDGTNGQMLATSATGQLYWATVAGAAAPLGLTLNSAVNSPLSVSNATGTAGLFQGVTGVAAFGTAIGISATASGTDGVGVLGKGNGGGQSYGVEGFGSPVSQGIGVIGRFNNAATPASLFSGAGAAGLNDSGGGWGIYARANGAGAAKGIVSEASAIGISATASNADGIGGIFQAVTAVVASGDALGISATAKSGSAVYARASTPLNLGAVEAINDGFNSGSSGLHAVGGIYGVYAQSNSSGAAAVRAENNNGAAVHAVGGWLGVSATASSAVGQAFLGRANSTSPTAEFINDSASGVALKVNGMKYPATDGTNGQMLATSATGQLYWANAPTVAAPLSLTNNTAVTTLSAFNTFGGSSIYGLNNSGVNPTAYVANQGNAKSLVVENFGNGIALSASAGSTAVYARGGTAGSPAMNISSANGDGAWIQGGAGLALSLTTLSTTGPVFIVRATDSNTVANVINDGTGGGMQVSLTAAGSFSSGLSVGIGGSNPSYALTVQDNITGGNGIGVNAQTGAGKAVYGVATGAGFGVYGQGLTGVAGIAGLANGIGVVAQQGSGALALRSTGTSLFEADVTVTGGDASGGVLRVFNAAGTGYAIHGKDINGKAIVAEGNSVGLSATALAGNAVYGRNNTAGAATAEFVNDGTGPPLKLNSMLFPSTDGGVGGNVLKTDGVGNLSFGPASAAAPLSLTLNSAANSPLSVSNATGVGELVAGGSLGISVTASAANANGVYARINAASGNGALYGINDASGGYGVYGSSNSVSGGYGVYGNSASSVSGAGVYGNGGNYGVYGTGTGTGVYGSSSGQEGVEGLVTSANGYGVYGLATSGAGGTGVFAQGVTASVALGTSLGLSATASAAAGQAVYGRGASTAPIAEFINDSASGVALKVNGMKYPATDGTNGQMLATSATGQLYWSSPTVPNPLSLTNAFAGNTAYFENDGNGPGLGVFGVFNAVTASVNDSGGFGPVVAVRATALEQGTNLAYGVSATAVSTLGTAIGVFGLGTGGLTNYGVYGKVTAPVGAGIVAEGVAVGLSAVASGGSGKGIVSIATSGNSVGVLGAATYPTSSFGNPIGVMGYYNAAGVGVGVLGHAGAQTTLFGAGVKGISDSDTAYAGHFINTSASAGAIAIRASSTSGGVGVSATADPGIGIAVYGTAYTGVVGSNTLGGVGIPGGNGVFAYSNTTAAALMAWNENNTANSVGIFSSVTKGANQISMGVVSLGKTVGVSGTATAGSAAGGMIGVYGAASGATTAGIGVKGDAGAGFTNNIGVFGTVAGAAAPALAAQAGVLGEDDQAGGIGVYGGSSSATGIGVVAQGQGGTGIALKVNGMKYPGTDGTNGQMLATSATGQLYWANPASTSAPLSLTLNSNTISTLYVIQQGAAASAAISATSQSGAAATIQSNNTFAGGYGIQGNASAGIGVYGTSTGNGMGVYGSVSGTSFGIEAQNQGTGLGLEALSSWGTGIYAQGMTGTVAVGNTIGISVTASNATGMAIVAGNNSTFPTVFAVNNGNGMGLDGQSAGSGYGVYGASGSNVGVYGTSNSGVGVQGVATTNNGVQGISDKSIGVWGNYNQWASVSGLAGVMGYTGSTTGTVQAFGVRGQADGAIDNAGVVGLYNGGVTSLAIAYPYPSGAGIVALNDTTGGWGSYIRASATSTSIGEVVEGGLLGVSASASSATGTGIFARGGNGTGAAGIYATGANGVVATNNPASILVAPGLGAAVYAYNGFNGQSGLYAFNNSSTGFGIYVAATATPNTIGEVIQSAALGLSASASSASGVALFATAGGASAKGLVVDAGLVAVSATSGGASGLAGYFQAVSGITLVSTETGISVTTGTTNNSAIFARANSAAATIRGINDAGTTGVQGIAGASGIGVKGTMLATAAAGSVGVYGSNIVAGGYGVEADNTVATAAAGGAALFVNGPVKVSTSSYSDTSTTNAPSAFTITTTSGKVTFGGASKVLPVPGAYGPFPCTNAALTANSIVLVTFNTASATVFSTTAVVNQAGNAFTVNLTGAAGSVTFNVATDSMKFLIINQ